MNMGFITDILLVDSVSENPLPVKLPSKNIVEVFGECLAVGCKVLSWIVPEQKELSLMGLTSYVTFETIGISTLLLTHLTVPSQFL